jgi:hypothetical protein
MKGIRGRQGDREEKGKENKGRRGGEERKERKGKERKGKERKLNNIIFLKRNVGEEN